jgi:hypothetical protein
MMEGPAALALITSFQQCFFENCQDKAIEAFVRQIVG